MYLCMETHHGFKHPFVNLYFLDKLLGRSLQQNRQQIHSLSRTIFPFFFQISIPSYDPTLQGQLLRGFLDGSTAVHLLLTNKSGIKSVPTGVKENVHFILDSSRNFEDRAKRKASNFGDDCGVWNRSSPKFHYILHIDGTLSTVFLRQNQYCDRKMIQI